MFECDKCGECCRNLRMSDIYKHLDRGDGVCKFLDGNLCSIYDERPIICRVDESYNLYFNNFYAYDEYCRLNKNACDALKEKRRI